MPLLPAFLIRLIDKFCAIRISGGQVSSCHDHTPAHRRSAWAVRVLASHTELPKMVGTIPTSIVYDNVTQCFGEPCPGQCDFRKNRTIGCTRYTAACSLVSRPPSIPWNVAPTAQSTPVSNGSTHRRVSSDVAGPFSAVCSRVASSDQERPWRAYLLLREKVPRRGG